MNTIVCDWVGSVMEQVGKRDLDSRLMGEPRRILILASQALYTPFEAPSYLNEEYTYPFWIQV